MPLSALAPLRRRARGRQPRGAGQPADPQLKAYALEPRPEMRLVRAERARAWMADTPSRYAYRCLPLLMANQAGWLVLNRHPVRAIWDGGDSLDSVVVEPLADRAPPVRSHFGSGILTWNLPFLFRTSPGYNLLVRGPANWPKDGAWPLEGLVETDWAPATFTMNWKLTRPSLPVVFDADEPICMIVPQRRGELESFRPSLCSILRAPGLARHYESWSSRRAQFLLDLREPGSEAQRQGWQRDYVNGLLPDGSRAPAHQTKLHLRDFSRADDG